MKYLNVVITSDPQYPWTERTDNNHSENEDNKNYRSAAFITEQYQDINDYASQSSHDTVVLINGDLTAFGHGWQRDKISELISILKPPVRWGLGNHDIENNYNDTANNGAATDMMRMYIDHYISLSLSNKSWDATITQESNHVDYVGSFNYSWDEGDCHFIQMNNFPGMTDFDFNKTTITTDKRRIYMRWDDNLTWLKSSITGAIARGKAIIINIHKPDTWPAKALESMQGVFSTYKDNIKAIFSGHYHKKRGYSTTYTKYMGSHIPVFLSGSAAQRSYLIMECAEHGIQIYLVTENNWRERRLIYGPMLDEHDKVIKAGIDTTKVMTASSASALTLHETFEFPEQLLSIYITKHIYDLHVYSISQSNEFSQSAKGNKLFWNKNGTPDLHFVTDYDSDYSRWYMDFQLPSMKYVFSSYINSNKSIDIPGSVTKNGTGLIMYNRTNGDNQSFIISDSRLGEPVYIVSQLNTYWVLSSELENRNAILYKKDSGIRQVFVCIRCNEKGNDIYQIVNVATGFILALNTYTESELGFYKNEYKDEHYWKFEIYGGGTYIISNYKNPNLVLDVTNAQVGNGTRIQLHSRNGNYAQVFSFVRHPTPPIIPETYKATVIIKSPIDQTMAVHVNSENAQLIFSKYNSADPSQKFHLVRARGKGASVYQIRSITWPDAVVSMYNGDIYLTANQYQDSQFWSFHESDRGFANEFVIANLSEPDTGWLTSAHPVNKIDLSLATRPVTGHKIEFCFTIEKI